MSERTAWVLWHGYHGEGSPDVFRVYLDEVRANEDFDLVRSDPAGGTCWTLTETYVYGGTPIELEGRR